ncbi:MAG: hypothetical protein ACYDAI_11045 [Trichloromonadaceae bacterium]
MARDLSRKEIKILSAGIDALLEKASETGLERYLKKLRSLYNRTKNPLFVWAAFDLCRKIEAPAPEWVMQYFAESARKLLRRANSADPPGNDASTDIAWCLNMSTQGQGTVFSRFKKDGLRLYVAEMFWRLRYEQPLISNAIIAGQVSLNIDAERDIELDTATIEKWAYEFKPFC